MSYLLRPTMLPKVLTQDFTGIFFINSNIPQVIIERVSSHGIKIHLGLSGGSVGVRSLSYDCNKHIPTEFIVVM